MNIWGFAATLYYLFTNKKPPFICNQIYDTLDSEEEKRRLVKWGGMSDEELNRILQGCDNDLFKRNAQAFFKKCLHADTEQRYRSMNEIFKKPLFAPGNEDLKDVTKKLKEVEEKVCDEGKKTRVILSHKIAKVTDKIRDKIRNSAYENVCLMVNIQTIITPYLFTIVGRDGYKIFLMELLVQEIEI